MKKITPWEPKHQSGFQKAVGFAVFVVAVGLVVAGILKILEIFFLDPLRYLLISRERLLDMERAKELAKKKTEAVRRAQFRGTFASENNPMNQYLNRYILHPENFEGDSDNEYYLQWYKDWKAGRVLDSDLRWIPEAYINDRLNPEYADYMELQWNLHDQKGSWREKKAYLRAIIQPSMKDAKIFIDKLKATSSDDTVKVSFSEELQKEGVPEEVASYILSKELTGLEIRDMVTWLKPFITKEYSNDVLRMAVHMKGDVVAKQVDMIQDLVNKGMNVLVAYPLAKGLITTDEAMSLHNRYVAATSFNQKNDLSKGDESYLDPDKVVTDSFDEIVKKRTREYNKNKMDQETGEAVWIQS